VKFTFEKYSFDAERFEAKFEYSYGEQKFVEKVSFVHKAGSENLAPETQSVLDRAVFLAFILIGTSYWKAFPTREVELATEIDRWQAEFFDHVYQEGMSQFAYGNQLTRDDLAHFAASNAKPSRPPHFQGDGVLVLQSGGKDSLLTAQLLETAGLNYTPLYFSSVQGHHPAVLNELNEPILTAGRAIDRNALRETAERGAMNGHVPVTYIIESLAIVQAILLGKNQILASIGNEADEPHAHIGDLAVNHQWSKSWAAETALSEYARRYISPDIRIGSPLRAFSELEIAELFSELAWSRFGNGFSSCNRANYRQGNVNEELHWCGECPKCANSYLLFAPFIPAHELQALFGGKDLFADEKLALTFKGLLGIDGVTKPFECIGSVEELRKAYEMIDFDSGYARLPFPVPHSDFDYQVLGDCQKWAHELIQKALPDK
jgi:hypothetical protein